MLGFYACFGTIHGSPYFSSMIPAFKCFLVSIFCCFFFNGLAQDIQVLQGDYHGDSSYYHLAKINDNEYWASGESGVLTVFDSLGNFRKLPFSLQGKNILKVERFANTVFIVSDDQVIFKYNLQDSVLTAIHLRRFRNRCFYDFQILPDGKMLLCGGSTGISRALKKIPHGFILLTDTSLQKTHIVWRSFRKFVWSLCSKDDGQTFAAVFNGINTKVLTSTNLTRWKKHAKVRGLVHDMKIKDGSLLYAGGTSFHFYRPGFLSSDTRKEYQIHPGSGCIWSQEISGDQLLACTQSGQIIVLTQGRINTELNFSRTQAIYDFKLLSSHLILAVGHGRYAALMRY